MGFSPANLLFFLWAMTTTVSGVVVDEAGRPVTDAEVLVTASRPQPDGVWDFTARAPGVRTSQEGRFQMERVATGRLLEMAVIRPGFAPSFRTVQVPKRGSLPPLRITLRRGRTVSGTVVDGEGRPAAGVEVELTRSRAAFRMVYELVPPDQGLHQTRTGPDDRFTLPDLPTGSFDLAALGPGFRSLLEAAVQVGPGTEPLDLGTFTLERSALAGRVLDPEGLPVAGAEVWLLSEDLTREWWAIDFDSETPAAIAGADGRFEIPSLPSRGWEGLQVCRKGFLTAHAEPPAGGGAPVEVVLVPTVPLSGRVLDPRGEPVAGARVSAWLSGTSPGGDDIGPEGPCIPDSPGSDAEGRFSLDLEKPGWYDVQAEAEGLLRVRRERVRVPSGEDVVLTLETGATVEGRILDPEGGPIPGARITIFGGRGFSSGASLPDGSYRLPGVEPGSRSLEASHPDYSSESRDLDIAPEGKRVDLVLHPREQGEIHGRVLGPDGEPVEGALVSTVLDDRTTTNADGSFLLVVQDEGDGIWLCAEKEGYGAGGTEVLPPPPVSGVEIHLVRGVGLTGRLLGLEPEELAWVGVKLFAPGLPEREAVIGPDGRYRILDLPPGKWTLHAWSGDRDLRESILLTPDSPETVHDLVFPSVTEVRGHVTGPEEEPLAQAEVSFRSQGSWQEVETEADGSFSIRLEDGDYSVTASLEGYFGGEAGRIVQVAGVPVDGVDFRLQQGAVLTGRLLGLEPGEWSGHVSAYAQGGKVSVHGMADQEGNYRISGLSPGAWKVVASFMGSVNFLRTGRGQVILAPGESEAALDLDLSWGELTLTGRLTGRPENLSIGVQLLLPDGTVLIENFQPLAEEESIFRFSRLRAGSYRVRLQGERGRMLAELPVDLFSDREIVFDLSGISPEEP